MILDGYSYTSTGGRSYNQDAVGMNQTESGSIFVLADGLGGHLHGEMASKCAVDTLLNAELPEPDQQSQWLQEQIKLANGKILELQEQNGTMRTTVVTLVIQKNHAAWAHVGDSRLYYLHNKKIEAFTEDHSVAYKKYLAGEITREQIGFDEDQSSLLRALGNPDRNQPMCNMLEHPLEAGDGFLLCSDGAWEYIMDEEILVDFLKADCAQTWAELLLMRILERLEQGNDNLSIITVMVT